ncbi:MAG: Fe-S cluster assembly protein IscX [Magnetococcus sp. YQC-3]
MRWTDVQEIGIALAESKPEVEPLSVRFTDLMEWVLALPGFADAPERCNEKILEAIQMAWLDERD